MRAPVYRHIEAESSIAGLSLPAFLVVLGMSFVAMQFLGGPSAFTVVAAVYGLLRLASHGRPTLYWQHFFVWHFRRLSAGQRLSAAARARVPAFPFGTHESREARFGR